VKKFNPDKGDRVIQPFPANGISGELISVRTNSGIRVEAWRPIEPLPPYKCQRYFCHGHSLGTYSNFGYTVMSGPDLHRVLADEYFKVGTLGFGNLRLIFKNDIIVWWQGLNAIHSARVKLPVQNGNQLNVGATIVSSKTGTGLLRKNASLAAVNDDYKEADVREIYRFWGPNDNPYVNLGD
jgi:hypothetical protein